MRYVLAVSYDGTHFAGWQLQKNCRTVQGVLERAALELFNKATRIQGSGRTDAGVHARFQVCQFEAETNIPAHKLRECFNRILPPDVSVVKSAAAPGDFDCTRAQRIKMYVYRVYCAACTLPLSERYETRLTNLPDVARMKSAARLLIGRHDFKAFSAKGSSVKTSEREILSVEISKREEGDAVHIGIEVRGYGFLYNMVRIIAGELIAIGLGKEEKFIQEALETGNRKLLAKTMPAKGLMLLDTQYDAPLFGENKE